MDGQISVRALVLLLVGVTTVYVVLHNPELGAAIGIGVIVTALVHDLLNK